MSSTHPYVGLDPATRLPATGGPHTMVSGPTGIGKSRRVLAPAVLVHQGPVIAVSSKPDLVGLCIQRRASWAQPGHTMLLDLSGEVPDRMLPEGTVRVVIDPVALISTGDPRVADDDALDLASVLIKTGTLGSGDGKGSGGDAFWETQARGPLAAILRAAPDVTWALEAVSLVDPPEDDDNDDDGPPPDARPTPGDEQPSWVSAVERLEALGSTMLADQLLAAMKRDPKVLDSIAITMQTALTPWMRSTVRGRSTEEVFHPRMLEHLDATLFVVAPADGVAAGAAVAMMDMVTAHWRRSQVMPEDERLPELLAVIDELTNTMPWPKLPTVVTESRAMGLRLLLAVQSTSQLHRRYGEAGMKELRDVMPSFLLLLGSAEKDLLEKAAWSSGQTEHQKLSTDTHGRESQSSEKSAVLDAVDLLPHSMDEGRLLRGRRSADEAFTRTYESGLLVRLSDISTMKF